MRKLRKNMKSVRENGTMLIEKIGGKGGAKRQVYFRNERSRIRATSFKAKNWEYKTSISKYFIDYRKFIKTD